MAPNGETMPPKTLSNCEGDLLFLSTLPAAFLSVPDRAKIEGPGGDRENHLLQRTNNKEVWCDGKISHRSAA